MDMDLLNNKEVDIELKKLIENIDITKPNIDIFTEIIEKKLLCR